MSKSKDQYPKIFTGKNLVLTHNGLIFKDEKYTCQVKEDEFAVTGGDKVVVRDNGDVFIENKKAGFVRVIKKADRVDL